MSGTSLFMTRNAFPAFLSSLRNAGYGIVGPTVRDGAIVYDAINRVEDLPIGWTDEQEPGRYRLKLRSDSALFGFVVGPQSWKKYLFPPRSKLWEARKTDDGFQVHEVSDEPQRLAFLGVRACELKAISAQDKVFLGGGYTDSIYAQRRDRCLLIAVQCGLAGKTCFCASMNAGPRAKDGFDLALTELLTPDQHGFLVEVGSDRGATILNQVPHRPATAEDLARAQRASESAIAQMGRTFELQGIKELLQAQPDHPRWDEVAERCITCANCTLVCPTCFCSTVEDMTDLNGDHAERWRRWDSCFTMEFSYLHGGSVRTSAKSRYRQWLTHKLSTWHEQFGTSGCVGCGRCITWCPVGIDLTQEVDALRKPSGREGDRGTS